MAAARLRLFTNGAWAAAGECRGTAHAPFFIGCRRLALMGCAALHYVSVCTGLGA